MSWVYVIVSGRRAKVGYSADPLRRLKTLQTGSATELTLAYVVGAPSQKLETEAHKALRSTWSHGEWFDAVAACDWARAQPECYKVSDRVSRVRIGRRGVRTTNQAMEGFGRKY
jgi:hypothetical protein